MISVLTVCDDGASLSLLTKLFFLFFPPLPLNLLTNEQQLGYESDSGFYFQKERLELNYLDLCKAQRT